MLAVNRIVVIAVAAFVALLLGFHQYGDDVREIASARISKRPRPHKSALRDTIHTLFDPVRHPITSTSYTDANGTTFATQFPSHWTKPLKHRILIVDIDTRVPDGKNEILNETGKLDWETLVTEGGGLVSGAIMGHFFYAQAHGYDYKLFQAQRIDGYYDTWISPHVLAQLLPAYDFVVTMDADVTITHPDVPLEWLFNHWGISKRTSIALPWDQTEMRGDAAISVDSKGVQVLNTGLMIVQNLQHTFDMLTAWKECPEEGTYEGCGTWKTNWSHEQRAFSEYIRYDFNPDGDNVVPIPCDDAMGFPGMKDMYRDRLANDCRGNFFRHHTLNKERTKEDAATGVMQVLAQLLQRELLTYRDQLSIRERKQKGEVEKVVVEGNLS